MLVVRAGAGRAQGGSAGPRPGSRPAGRAAVLGGGSRVRRKAEAEWVAGRAVRSGWRPFTLTRPGPSASWFKQLGHHRALGIGTAGLQRAATSLRRAQGRG